MKIKDKELEEYLKTTEPVYAAREIKENLDSLIVKLQESIVEWERENRSLIEKIKKGAVTEEEWEALGHGEKSIHNGINAMLLEAAKQYNDFALATRFAIEEINKVFGTKYAALPSVIIAKFNKPRPLLYN